MIKTEQPSSAVEIASCCGPVAIKSVSQCVPTKIADCKEPDYERCTKCGYLFVPGESRARECNNPESQKIPLEMPSFIATAARYVQAYAKFKASGKQVASLPQIVNRFRICSTCPQYNDAEGRCAICGCFVNLLHDGQGMNKLEWATENCPHNPPKWNKLAQGR